MKSRRPRVGVLALQGGVLEHARMLESLGAEVVLVRQESNLVGAAGPRIDALVLPGGESGVQERLLSLFDLVDPLRACIAAHVPVLGTCAGLILMAHTVIDPAPDQESLGFLDVSVRRNAFGPQVASADAEFAIDATNVTGTGTRGAVRGALIRAPEVVAVGVGARAIASVSGRILGATSVDLGRPGAPAEPHRLGRITGISFHPEISGDPAFHKALLDLADEH